MILVVDIQSHCYIVVLSQVFFTNPWHYKLYQADASPQQIIQPILMHKKLLLLNLVFLHASNSKGLIKRPGT